MKGPSLDAIRKFKEQQERKKQEEDERKLREKLSTLEHRAAQGDRKAKHELKIIEKVKEDRNSASQLDRNVARQRAPASNIDKVPSVPGKKAVTSKPKATETDFNELMKLAKGNKNEILKEDKPKEVGPISKIPKKPSIQRARDISPPSIASNKELSRKHTAERESSKNFSKSHIITSSASIELTHEQAAKQHRLPSVATTSRSLQPRTIPRPVVRAPPVDRYYNDPRSRYNGYRRHDDYDDYEEEEEDYEQDDFVVDDEDDDVQDELRKTIKSVFRYDKRRCDMREDELDRQYRAIGRVNTFEDLEREERRASRLAAAEDARAQREEEERKRLKKIRLQKS